MKKAPILIGDIWEKYYELYKTKETKKEKKKNRDKDKGNMSAQFVGALTSHAFGLLNKILLFFINALKSVLIML